MRKKKQEVKKSFAIEEIIRCAKNPIYFIDTYCKIQHPMKGLIKFKTYKYQQDTIKCFLTKDNVIVNKPRQMGYSTLVSAFIAWLILFHKDKTVIVLSKDAESAQNVIRKIKVILKNLPPWMYLADLVKSREHTIGLSNGSSVKSLARTSEAGRSEAASLIIFDEAAHIRDLDKIQAAASFTTATGGKQIALSTPSGPQGWFYETFTKAQTGENLWFPMLVNWWDNPEYADGLQADPAVPGGYTSPWFKRITSDKTETQIRQELLTSFIGSGDNFFNVDAINRIRARVAESKPIEKRDYDMLWLWKLPISGNKYIVSVDSCLGSGTDFAGFCVLELVNCEVVAEFKGKIPPDECAEKAVEVSQMYNDAYLLIENNGVGMATAVCAKGSGYKNLLYIDEKNQYRFIDRWVAEASNHPPGINLSSKLRPLVLPKLKEYVENDNMLIYSQRFANEMLNFVIENGKPQAPKGYNDDLIMSYALAIWARDSCPDLGFGRTFGAKDVEFFNLFTINNSKMPDIHGDRMRTRFEKTAKEQTQMVVGNNLIIDFSGLLK